jgi:ABC-type uncharacterized transport system involved in gliding motility auxiliary subunit
MDKIDAGRYSRFLIYLVAVVLLNIAGITFFLRADLTSSNVYSLSGASIKAVSGLSEPLTIKAFFSTNLPSPHNNTERYLHDLLEEYAIAGNRHFNYRFYNVSGEENDTSRQNRELAQSYGVHSVQIQNIDQDEVKFQKAFMGLVIIHGDIVETIPTITSTDGLEYQITHAINKMNNKISALLKLEDKISVKLFLSSSLRVVGPYMDIQGLAELPERINDIIARLNTKSYGKLAFIHLDPSVQTGAGSQASRYNILRMNWEEFRDRRGRTIAADTGYAGIVVEHGNRNAKIQLIEVIRLPIFGTQYQLTDMEKLEDSISQTIEGVIDINEEIGYLADHGTLPIEGPPPTFGRAQQQNSLNNFNRLLSKEYSIKQVKLKEDGIPDGLSTMIIAGARENFTEYELYQIDQFLMKGGNLAIFADSFNEVSPQNQQGMMGQFQRPAWLPVRTGLEKLLDTYGLHVRNSIVLDENSYKQKMPRQMGGGERAIYFAPIIKNEMINKEIKPLKNIKGLIMLNASPVEADSGKVKEHNLKAERLFSSSERSWEMKDRNNINPSFISPPREKDKFSSLPLAYTLEGSLPSYFAERPVPERTEPETVGKEGQETTEQNKSEKSGVDMTAIKSQPATIKKGRPAKIFLLGTSEILRDNVIDGEGKTPNAQFVMNIIDHLNNRDDIAVMRSKTQAFNPLKKIEPAARTAIKTANVAGLPVLVIIAGIVVWLKRSAKKRMIQKIFSR